MHPTHLRVPDPNEPTTRRVDGRPETDADRRFFDLREAGYTGPIDQDGHPVTDLATPVVPVESVRCLGCGEAVPVLRSWDELLCPQCVTLPEDAEGVTVDHTTAATPARTLRDAARYLIACGWCQGDMFADPDQPTPPACGLGAVHMAAFGITDPVTVEDVREQVAAFNTAVAAFADHLVLCYGLALVVNPHDGHVYCGGLLDYNAEQLVADWNDQPERIASHVIAALHGAADAWDRVHHAALVPPEPVTCPVCMGDCFCHDHRHGHAGSVCVCCAIQAEPGTGHVVSEGGGA
jgi:hypothetical protein